jgi:hypothetical protein
VDIYQRFAPIAGEAAMHYGAAHVVWDDENFDRATVQTCLDRFDAWKRADATDAENEAVRQSLLALLALSDAELSPEPSDYDGENPKHYPPRVEMAHHERC